MKILYVNLLRILELITQLKTFKFERAALASKGSLFMGNTVLTKSIKICMTMAHGVDWSWLYRIP